MRRPIRTQILLPFLATLLASVSLIAAMAVWQSVRKAEQQTLGQIHGVIETLTLSALTYTQPVLQRMRSLSGAEFVAIDSSGQILAATMTVPPDIAVQAVSAPLMTRERALSLSDLPRLRISPERDFFLMRLRADGAAGVSKLLVLYPEAGWREARRAAVLPPLIVGVASGLLMAVLSSWLASRISRRLQTVQRLLADIASGRRDDAFPVPQRVDDELDDLTCSAARLAAQLRELEQQHRDAERLRLLAQLAGGLAHQLRNAATGARMAVQIHLRRCPIEESDDSLTVALRQLSLSEQQLRGLLSLSHREIRTPEAGPARQLLIDVEQLVRPQFDHCGTQFHANHDEAVSGTLTDTDAFRTAVLNLLLNALEAAGPGGSVELRSQRVGDRLTVAVIDSGSGPPEDIRDSLFEPFVTSRPEGTGLGLALARQSAERLNGTLEWSRHDEKTVFELHVPVT